MYLIINLIMGNNNISEDMIDGTCCSLCGQYFEDNEQGSTLYTHGYPVACDDCWEDDCGYLKAEASTF